MSEAVAVGVHNVYHLPEAHDFAEGASLLMTYGTSIHALVDRGRIKEGDTLLVLGASGGVGIAAVELGKAFGARVVAGRSEEHTSELQSLMRISYAVFCLKKKNKSRTRIHDSKPYE